MCLLMCACKSGVDGVYDKEKNIIYFIVISVSVDFVFEAIKICWTI